MYGTSWLLGAILLVNYAANGSNWHKNYVTALRSAPAQACKIFSRLAKDKRQQIWPLAQIRAIKSCESTNLKPIEDILDDGDLTWLHPMAANLAYSVAHENGDDASIIYYAPQTILNLKSQRDKEQVYRQAISAALNLSKLAEKKKLEEALFKLSPRLIPNPAKDKWRSVAKDFQKNRKFQQASDYFLKIFNDSTNWQEKLDALDGSRRALKEKFRTGQGPVSEFHTASKVFGEYAFKVLNSTPGLSLDEQRKLVLAFFQHGRDIWSYANGAVDQKAGIRKVVKRYINSPNTNKFLVADAWVLLTRVSQNYKEWSTGIAESDQAIKILNTLGSPTNWNKWQRELFDKALWFNAHLSRKTGNLKLSYQKLKVVESSSTAGWARRRGLFWLGRTAKLLGKSAESKSYYDRLIKDNPYHYYSIWARYDSGRKVPVVSPLAKRRPSRPKGVSRSDHALIVSLVEATELGLARSYLNGINDPKSIDITDLKYRDFVGDHKTVLYSFFFQMNSTQKRNIQDNYLSLIFPTPHKALVQRHANRWSSLDQFYVYSIMRQESAYDPSSHSWADARGLLQLVPRAAHGEQKRAGVTYQHVDELFIPEVNIPIGIAALDTRFAKNKNNYILATASYNAGEARVHRWYNHLFEGDVFEFMEDIPTEETRLYIRLVARNYIRNMQLSEKRPFLVPKWLFELN